VTSAPAGVDHYLEDARSSGITPGAVAWVAEGSSVLHRCVVGDAQSVPSREPMQGDTPFDLASLTKPLVTAALALVLEKDLDLPPETPVRSLLPELDTLAHRDINLRHLLTHSSGLPAWCPLFMKGETVAAYLEALRDEPLVGRPGERAVYSDPGYMAAAEMLARAAGSDLAELFAELFSRPLGLSACFRPGPEMARRAAATEVGQEFERAMAGEQAAGYDGWREGTIRGQVHDHHTWVAGGVLGSAGLFGTADDVHRLALECLGEGRGLIPARAVARMRARWAPAEGEARSEGFALNPEGEGSCGPALPDSAYGHTGKTGTSVWIDPDRRRIYILLTNRVHPSVRPVDMLGFRRGFHQVAAALPGG